MKKIKDTYENLKKKNLTVPLGAWAQEALPRGGLLPAKPWEV